MTSTAGSSPVTRVEDVLITGELATRPSRMPDYENENRALSLLAQEMATNPRGVLQKCAELVMELCHADSAGISILELGGTSGMLSWQAAAGAFAPNLHGTMPQEASPCGTVMERDRVLLFKEAERFFPALQGFEPRIYENLLTPWHAKGKPVGTLWAIKHSPEGRFDAEDARLLKSLSNFAAAAFQMHESEQALASDLASAEVLRSLSERLVTEDSLQSVYEDVLSATIAIAGADAGTVQIYDPATKSLELIASRNLSRAITGYFHRVDAGSRTACGISLKTGAYAFIDFQDEAADYGCQLHIGEGIQSAVAYPVMSRSGSPLGMLNAHWRDAKHRLNDRELRFLGLLARQAADLIEQRRSQSALRESEEKQRLMIELVPALLWSASADGQMISLNERWLTFTGQSEAETQDYGWLDAIHPDDLPGTRAAFENAFAIGEPLERQHRIHKAGDGWRWHLVRHVPVRDAHGAITGWFGAAVDIHESKLAEQALQDTERRLQSLVEGVPQLVWRAVDGGHWTWASPQWTEYTGQAEADSHGLGWLGPVQPEDREHVQQVWAGAIERGEFHADYRICHKAEDRYRWFQTRATPVRDDRGEIVEWLGTSTDVDDLRGLQERQQVMVAELQHRTRNLMGVVRSTADRTGEASKSFEDFRDRFRDRLEALARVQGLLSRLNETDRIAFDELIRTEVAAMDGSADQVTLDGPSGVRLRSSMVQTLAMALHELATNAVKYGALGQPDGHLAVSWRMVEPDRRGRPRLRIDWRESGVKMPPPGRAPQGGGQGRELIERALPYQLNAETSFDLGPDGVHCTITIPVSVSTAVEDANG